MQHIGLSARGAAGRSEYARRQTGRETDIFMIYIYIYIAIHTQRVNIHIYVCIYIHMHLKV